MRIVHNYNNWVEVQVDVLFQSTIVNNVYPEMFSLRYACYLRILNH